MTEIPRRLTLVTQTADILRREIQGGEWKDVLPGENPLCDRLQVSRITIRAALDILQREGWIAVGKGRRRRVLRRNGAPVQPTASTTVGLVAPTPFRSFSTDGMYRVSELRRLLQAVGFHLEVHTHPRLAQKNAGRLLDQLVRQVNARCWVLCVSTAEMQHWFEKHRIPSVVMGSMEHGVDLTSVGLHLPAMARHAVGMCTSLGHQRLALLLPQRLNVDASIVETSFLEGIRQLNRPQVVAVVVRHDSTREGVNAMLRRLLAGPKRPTVLLVSGSMQTLAVYSHLTQMGVRIPRDVSLVSLSDQDYLSMLTPALTRYRFDHKRYADALFRVVLALARDVNAPTRNLRIMPRFFRGETLAKPPDTRSLLHLS